MGPWFYNILLSLLTGIVSSIIAVIIIHIRSRRKFKKQLAKYVGEWKSYPVFKNKPLEEEKFHLADVSISLNGDTLYLYHKNVIKQRIGVDWEAYMLINREFTSTGRLTWQYIKTCDYSDMGIKEFILKETETGYELYLIPINIRNQNYEFEVCVKNKNH